MSKFKVGDLVYSKFSKNRERTFTFKSGSLFRIYASNLNNIGYDVIPVKAKFVDPSNNTTSTMFFYEERHLVLAKDLTEFEKIMYKAKNES